jgi:hypothetical protein
MNLQETVSKMLGKKVSAIDARFLAESQFGMLTSFIRGTNPAVTALIELYSTQLTTQKQNRAEYGETYDDAEMESVDADISRTAEFIRNLKSLNNAEN